MKELLHIIAHFPEVEDVAYIDPINSGLINETYKVTTASARGTDYILQRINNQIFKDVDMLQHNIEVVTRHIKKKLEARGEENIERKVLRYIHSDSGKTYYKDEAGKYWRMSVFIPESITFDTVNVHTSGLVGIKFGEFEDFLSDLPEKIGEVIPHFHDMEYRVKELQEAIQQDKAGRLSATQYIADELLAHADEMCLGERLYKEGKLPKRICHCDTKVSNMLFDTKGHVLCVIDLDTVMPNFVFSDFGDFLRSAANTAQEDEKDLTKVQFNMRIFKAFTEGYLRSATFLTPTEKKYLPFATLLFPYMQAVRFFTDYLNGDTYYKIKYPEHNLVRTKAQYKLYKEASAHEQEMADFIKAFL